MQKSLFFRSSSSYYLIPILLFIFSFAIYSYNLEGQPLYGDEMTYFAWGGVYFDLIKNGELDHPCIKGLEGCGLLFDPSWSGRNMNYTPLRNFFVGFGQFLTTGANEGHFYSMSCLGLGNPCWDPALAPSIEEITNARFFSPIFGSLAIVLAFLIGKNLFDRTIGLSFSLILLFYSIWLIHSRLIMTEVYLHFFILLSIFLLLKSFKKTNNHRIPFFVFGAISFGIALHIKLVAVEVLIPILVMILFYDSFNKKLNFRFFKNRKNLLKAISLVLGFIVIFSISFVASFPRYYDNTLNKLLDIQDDTETGFVSLPTEEKNYLFLTLATLQNVLLPYLMDSFIDDVFSEEAKKARLLESPPNFSTIPLSLFFFVGLINLIRKIKTGNLKFSEFSLLVWFTSLFIFSVLIIDFVWIGRYYLPLMFPIMLIASYALGDFIKQIQNQKEKILFFTLFITVHSLYIISFFDKLYFSNIRWFSPFPVTSQLSLIDPLVYVSTIIFVGVSFLIYLRVKMKISSKTRQEFSK